MHELTDKRVLVIGHDASARAAVRLAVAKGARVSVVPAGPESVSDRDIEALENGSLTKEQEVNCFRIIQESLNNIVKHSQATKAYVELWREDGALRLTVRDNGRGYDVGSITQRGLGLTSISERVRILGGTQMVTTAPGAGTMIRLRIPQIGRASCRERVWTVV